jgi:hypothetical protein
VLSGTLFRVGIRVAILEPRSAFCVKFHTKSPKPAVKNGLLYEKSHKIGAPGRLAGPFWMKFRTKRGFWTRPAALLYEKSYKTPDRLDGYRIPAAGAERLLPAQCIRTRGFIRCCSLSFRS